MTDDKQRKAPVLRFKGFHDDWEQRKLGSKVNFYNGLTYHPDDVKELGTFVIRSNNVKNNQIIKSNSIKVSSNIINVPNVEKDDIVVVVRNGSKKLIGKHALINNSMPNTVIGAFMTGIRSNNNKFIKSLLDSSLFKKEIQKNLGATINQITISDFKNMKFNFPTSIEQNKIGNLILKIDKLLFLQQRKYKILLNLQNTLLMSTLKLKPKVDPVVYFKTSSNKIGKFLLKDVARITMGQSPSSKNYFEKPVGEVLIQGNADIKKNSIYPRIWTTEVTKEVNIGDIILTVRAPVGGVAIADRKAVIGRGVAGISTNNQVIFYYLKLMKNTHIWDRLSSGSTFQSISSKDINNLPLYLPNQETQLKIVKLLNSVLKKISAEENKINTTEELKQFLLQNMFI